MSRSAEYESEWLRNLVRDTARRHGIHHQAFPQAVLSRAGLGAQRYGDDAFLNKDMVAEGLEETPDVGVYIMLEIQKRLGVAAELDPEALHYLYEAAIFACAADWALRRVQQIDKGIE